MISPAHSDDFAIIKGLHIQRVAGPADRAFARSSAGVYSGKRLIRTLWNERPFNGVIDGRLWDGRDDDGKVAPSGNYVIKVMDASGVSYTWDGVIGNTSSLPHRWNPMDVVHGMAITSAGKIYVACGYSEARGSTYKTTVSNPQVPEFVLPVVFRQTGPISLFVATDDTRTYFAGGNLPRATSAVWALNVATDTIHTFASGLPYQAFPGGHRLSSAISLINGAGCRITGLAVQKSGDLLFVARSGLNSITVYNKVTGALVTTITSINSPTRMRCDAAGDLWIAYTSSGGAAVAKFAVDSQTGALSLVRGSQISGLFEPLALAITPDGGTLRIADGGNSQQIKSYATATSALTSTYGRASGYAVGPDVTFDKFWFHNPNGITLGVPSLGVYGGPMTFLEHQPDGKLWVGDSANCRSLLFTVSGARYAYHDQIAWIGAHYSVAIDRNNAARVCANWLEFEIDFSKQPGERGWWKLARNWGFGITSNYNDQNFRMLNLATLRNGRTYAQPRSYSAGNEIVELSPTGLRFTGVTGSLTTTALASDGSLRILATPAPGKPIVFQKRDLLGFDRAHNPLYGPLTTIASTPPTLPTDPTPRSITGDRAPWAASPDGVVVVYDSRKEFRGWHLGGIDIKSGQWRWRAMPSTPRNLFSTKTLSQWTGDGYFDTTSSSTAGNNVWVLGANVLAGYHGEGWGPAQVNKWYHFHADTGLLISNFGVVLEGDGESQPGMAGNASRGSVSMRNGVLYLCHNDESYGAGAHRWSISGLDSIAFHEVRVSWNARTYAAPARDANNLLEGLPYDASLVSGTAGWTRDPPVDTPGNAGVGPFWQVGTNHVLYRKADVPDLTARFNFVGNAHVEKLLPAGIGAEWEFSALLQSTQGDTGANLSALMGFAHLELLDATNRVIARWHAHDYTPSSLWGVYCNRTLIQAFGSTKAVTDVIKRPQQLTIRRTKAGAIFFRYGFYPEISAPLLDAAADGAAPSKIRLSFHRGVGGGYFRQITLREARFHTFR